MKKKGYEYNLFIVFLVLALIFGAIYLLGGGRIWDSFRQGTDYEITANKLRACRAASERGHPATGEPYADDDGDGLPNYCDNCLNLDNGKNAISDKDGDLFPEGCNGNNGAGEKCPPEETHDNDKDAKKHPCYKWGGEK